MDEKSKSLKSGGSLKWLVLGALVVLAFIVVLWLLPGNEKLIQARIAAIKKAGYPVTAQDLAKLYPPIPDDQNSVIIYQKAFFNCAPKPISATNWPQLNSIALQRSLRPHPFREGTFAPDVIRSITNYLAQNRATLDLLHRAAMIEKAYYDTGFGGAFSNAVFARSFQFFNSEDLLTLATIVNSEHGHPDLATQTMIDSLGIARSLERGPLMEAQMDRFISLGLSCSSLEQALNETSFSDDELLRITVALHEAEHFNGIKLALISERCEGIAFDDQIGKRSFLHQNDISLLAKLRVLIYYFKKFRESSYLFYLDKMEEYIAAADLPLPERLKAVEQINLKAKQSDEFERGFAEILDTEVEQARFLADAKIQAELRLSETALAFERYRLANQDRLPASLQDLTPQFLPTVSLDPFDGQPLRYKPLAKGYLIYSIGEDGVDNGGREWDEQKKSGDITFTVER